MFSYIFLIFAVVVIVLAANAIKNKNTMREDLGAISQELAGLLSMVQGFVHSTYWEGEVGLVMVIPVNSRGDLYRPGADRIRVSVLLYRDDPDSIRLFSQTEEIISRFRLVQEDRNFSYMATTYCTFQSDYEKVMPTLYAYVQQQFPGVPFNFDGSRIMTDGRSM